MKVFWRFVFWLATLLVLMTMIAARATDQAWVSAISPWVWFAIVGMFVIYKLIVAVNEMIVIEGGISRKSMKSIH